MPKHGIQGEETPLLKTDAYGRKSIAHTVSSFLQEAIGSERQHELQKVWSAAHLVRDAFIGETAEPYDSWFDPYARPENQFKNYYAILCCHLEARLAWPISVAMWALVLLSFIEPPYWCRGLDIETDHAFGSCGAVLNAHDPTDEKLSYYPNFDVMLLTVQQAHTIQLVFIAVLFFRLLVRIGRNGFELLRFFYPGVRYVNSLRCLMLVLMIFERTSMYHPFFRLILLGTYLTSCQREMRTLIELLPAVLYILAIVGILIGFYSFVGVLLFDASEQGQRDFPNWLEGVWTLWICVTTANYPDVMMPSYNSHRFSGFFFLSFMVLSFFLLMNMVLGSVVDGYDTAMENRKEAHEALLRKNLSRAFELMDPNGSGGVDQETIMALFVVLNEDFPEIRRLSEEETVKLFASLDTDESASINAEEFQKFGDAMKKLANEPDYTTFVHAKFPDFYGSTKYQQLIALVHSTAFERIIDGILLLNAVVVVIESYPELAGEYIENDKAGFDGSINTPWDYAERLFTVLYTMEVGLKVMIDGWKKYSESPRNMFDFVITMAVLISSAYVYYPNDYSDNRLITFVVMLRVLRLGRLLMTFPALREITSISLHIIPKSKSILQLLFFVMYFFSALAVILYGGLITRDPQNPLSDVILDTDFANNDYWANNFNDMMSAMNVIFNLLVVNNWTTCASGYEAVTGGKWVRVFFFSFHIFGVVLINNLVIAFIINSFLQRLKAKSSGSTEEKQGEKSKVDNGAKISGSPTRAMI